jgi:hypothetical protein
MYFKKILINKQKKRNYYKKLPSLLQFVVLFYVYVHSYGIIQGKNHYIIDESIFLNLHRLFIIQKNQFQINK